VTVPTVDADRPQGLKSDPGVTNPYTHLGFNPAPGATELVRALHHKLTSCVKEMEKAHKEDDKAFKEEANTTTSPQLKEMVTQDAQMIESHLQQIQQIAQSKAAAKGS